jgi:hypothetical protein
MQVIGLVWLSGMSFSNFIFSPLLVKNYDLNIDKKAGFKQKV